MVLEWQVLGWGCAREGSYVPRFYTQYSIFTSYPYPRVVQDYAIASAHVLPERNIAAAILRVLTLYCKLVDSSSDTKTMYDVMNCLTSCEDACTM